jgi:Flp pilus assembly protein TadG
MVWRRSGSTARRKSLGQSVVEFALVLPVALTMVGATLDLARVYSTWSTLEMATRDAAQYVASDPGYTTTGGYYDSTDTTNYCATPPFTTACTSAPSTDAKSVLDAETGRTFSKSATQTDCTSPTVWAQLTTSTSAADGGNSAYPVATAVITSCMRFRALFAYPFFTQGGDWIIRVQRTYSIIVGR